MFHFTDGSSILGFYHDELRNWIAGHFERLGLEDIHHLMATRKKLFMDQPRPQSVPRRSQRIGPSGRIRCHGLWTARCTGKRLDSSLSVLGRFHAPFFAARSGRGSGAGLGRKDVDRERDVSVFPIIRYKSIDPKKQNRPHGV